MRETVLDLGSTSKLERWHKILKGECVRPGSPLSLQEARELVERYIQHYNEKRLHTIDFSNSI